MIGKGALFNSNTTWNASNLRLSASTKYIGIQAAYMSMTAKEFDQGSKRSERFTGKVKPHLTSSVSALFSCVSASKVFSTVALRALLLRLRPRHLPEALCLTSSLSLSLVPPPFPASHCHLSIHRFSMFVTSALLVLAPLLASAYKIEQFKDCNVSTSRPRSALTHSCEQCYEPSGDRVVKHGVRALLPLFGLPYTVDSLLPSNFDNTDSAQTPAVCGSLRRLETQNLR